MTKEYWTFISDIRKPGFWFIFSVAHSKKEAREHIAKKAKTSPFLIGRIEPITY